MKLYVKYQWIINELIIHNELNIDVEIVQRDTMNCIFQRFSVISAMTQYKVGRQFDDLQ